MLFYIPESPKERKRNARQCAHTVFIQGENSVTLILAGLFCMALSFICYFLVWALFLALYETPLADIFDVHSVVAWLAFQILILVVFWLLAMPFWFGMYRMAIQMTRGERAGATDFFHYVIFGSLYGRALGLSACLFVRWLPALVGYFVLGLFFVLDFKGFLLVCFFVVTVFLSLTFVSGVGGFVTVALSDDVVSFSCARRMARVATVGERMCLLRWDAEMLFWLFISLFPAGIPLLIYMLPMSMLSAVSYFERLTHRNENDL